MELLRYTKLQLMKLILNNFNVYPYVTIKSALFAKSKDEVILTIQDSYYILQDNKTKRYHDSMGQLPITFNLLPEQFTHTK